MNIYLQPIIRLCVQYTVTEVDMQLSRSITSMDWQQAMSAPSSATQPRTFSTT